MNSAYFLPKLGCNNENQGSDIGSHLKNNESLGKNIGGEAADIGRCAFHIEGDGSNIEIDLKNIEWGDFHIENGALKSTAGGLTTKTKASTPRVFPLKSNWELLVLEFKEGLHVAARRVVGGKLLCAGIKRDFGRMGFRPTLCEAAARCSSPRLSGC